MEESVRWSLKVSRATDEALREYLGQNGARKGDLSRFVQEAVQAKLRQEMRVRRRRRQGADSRSELAEALTEIRTRTKALSRTRFEKLVAEAVAYARKR